MKHLHLLIVVLSSILFVGCSHPSHQEIKLQEDTLSLLRNPCMGWGVYDDANDEVQNADIYWVAQDKAARQYASFFYIRWRWSDMEPEEGKYAWRHDDNYKKLIQGALDRGLKLCFRIYDNGQDNLRAGIPDYVRKAGAKGYTVKGLKGDLWTPYPDDPVFQQKLETFVQAFAKEYDHPEMVDFIDGYSLGWWGECHHVILQDQRKFEQVFDWFTTMYSTHFKNVILALPFGSQIGFETEKRIAIEGKGYAMRRDGLGSMWFSDEERKIANDRYGKTLLIGESCYWGCSSNDCKPFASDTRYSLKSWREVYEQTYQHAIEGHFNTLDLRELPETKGWTEKANDLVLKFMTKGGYRLYPCSISLPAQATAHVTNSITHAWKNTGNGYLPNNHPNWNYKYKPAFALFTPQGKFVQAWTDCDAEPSDWLHNTIHTYTYPVSFANISTGTYQWAVAIVDRTKNDQPGIKLAVEDKQLQDGWTLLGQEITIK